MPKNLLISLKEVLLIPIAASFLLAAYSLIIGWNLPTLLLFWFILLPFLAYKLPKMLSQKESLLKQSLIGLTLFYAIMVFMIYEHSQTDYFLVMMISFVVNLGLIALVSWVRKQEQKEVCPIQ
ncbi:MAG: hypothetical protein AAGG68_05460 [Bacteroidota bacterium]